MPFYIGQRLCYDGALCTVRYIGRVEPTTGEWLGVEWDDPTRGRHSGHHKEKQYFTAAATTGVSNSPTAGSFVRPSRPAKPAQSFISAVLDKYTSEVDPETQAIRAAKQIRIGTKMAEEVGFDKIRRQLAKVDQLKIVIVDSYRVAFAVAEGEKSVKEMVPSIQELDVSRNMLESVGVVVDICKDLAHLKSLRMGGNRFRDAMADPGLRNAGSAFAHVKELALNESMMSWEEITCITAHFPELTNLNCSTNQLSILPYLPLGSLVDTLTSLQLELNQFTAISDLSAVTELKVLRNLHLKGNYISTVTKPNAPVPLFSESLYYLDVSYNNISSWDFVDSLLESFPGLMSLRIAHNPVYDTTTMGDNPAKAQQNRIVSEESHMITIGRLPQIKILNFVSITADDRANAELFYLSRIARELAAVGKEEEETALKHHPRYQMLCEIYGAPEVTRQNKVNPDFLEARLIKVTFYLVQHNEQSQNPQDVGEEYVRLVPKSFDIYAVKGFLGRHFGIAPMQLRLIWETGEWDPVAALDEADETAVLDGDYSSDEEEAEAEREREGALRSEEPSKQHGESKKKMEKDSEASKMRRWIKRQVELNDSTRQLGFCVDGMEARIRVEMK
ncbi:Tubulin-specific chaperone E [Ceratocystis fimbriata CBS 114723]|uniref:Tubulin-specific chaperone E n=1 Tax=Ceratocystis fimbriata CBS 114723 TaxID=1035309 RepID=A0A2C5WW74_9PEZI|nr:Tubulin-specific chaperone E [Ceratocystis fimbriata CBS 114723]